MWQEDKYFFQILDESTRLRSGHYEIPLPFRNEDVAVPKYRVQEENRSAYPQRSIPKSGKFRREYMSFLKN